MANNCLQKLFSLFYFVSLSWYSLQIWVFFISENMIKTIQRVYICYRDIDLYKSALMLGPRALIMGSCFNAQTVCGIN